MPYCVQCGNQVGTSDRFCGKCGALQNPTQNAGRGAPGFGGDRAPYPAAAGVAADPFSRIANTDSRTASLLCYIPVMGWIMSIIVLASSRFRDNYEARFHAFQGLYLFVAWLIVDWVLSPMMHLPGMRGFHLGELMKAVIFGAWVLMLVKVSQREHFKLPVLGELAEKSVSEQQF
jgi:uncharacterized membrane protein